MHPATQKRQNRKAEQFCGTIGEQQESFLIHGFNYHEYGEKDYARIRTINRFFGLKTVYECIVLCFFIDRKLSDDSGISWKEITRHFSLNLQDCVQLNATIQYLVTRRLIGNNDGYRHRSDEYNLSGSCLNAILTGKKLSRTRRGNFIDGFLKDFDTVMINSNDFENEDILQQLYNVFDEYQSLPEIKWLMRHNLSSESAVIFFIVLRDHIFFRRSVNLEKILKIITKEPFMKYEMEKLLKSGNHQLIKENLLCFEADFFINDNLVPSSKCLDELSNLSPDIDKAGKKSFQPRLFQVIHPDKIEKENYLHNDPNLRLIEKPSRPTLLTFFLATLARVKPIFWNCSMRRRMLTRLLEIIHRSASLMRLKPCSTTGAQDQNPLPII